MIITIQGTLKIISILLLPLFVMTGCAASQLSPEQASDSEVRTKNIDRTVSGFLEALKNKDYQKAHGYVFMPDMDKPRYVNSMQEAQDQYRGSILGYKILGTRVLTKSALVDVEIELSYKPEDSQAMLHKKQILRYELTEIKGWYITGEVCISNCGN